MIQLTEFPRNIKFKYNWRKYQQRMLNELQEHLSDQHLHVIAPPGSGKTILGLEVMLRINKPTLILAPTVAIRNQWVQRFCESFIPDQFNPDWISKDIRKPKFVTVSTYQGLHAACNNFKIVETEDDEEDEEGVPDDGFGEPVNHHLDKIVKGLLAQNTKTIIADEAHHLKNEWWHTLISIKEKLDPVIVGLTATPPYDVSYNEWQRYLELNGPIDTEISVPELVIEGDLCPHQDYIYFSMPSDQENQKITAYKQNIESLFSEIKNDETLINAFEQHRMWQNPLESLDWIYDNLSNYSACLIFLNANGRIISESHLKVIGDEKILIPQFDYSWAEHLLEYYLFKGQDDFPGFEEHQTKTHNRLRHYGIIERRQVHLTENHNVSKLLVSSISKLNSIKDIVNFEYRVLGKDLRMVILSDYIRKEFLAEAPVNDLELNKIGVISIFEKLRRENIGHKKIGVLTGSMVIIPASAQSTFEQKALKCNIHDIESTIIPFDKNYVVVTQSEELKHEIVQIVTQLFQEGNIEILIGTKSLLGEGWDAPAINSLILASFVGSFVLSNQMRGRAIRIEKGNINKTGNIWHLVCIDPTSPAGGEDLALLNRRFKGFVGISMNKEAGIENGIERLNIPANIHLKEVIENKNNETLTLAGERESLKNKWKIALEKGVNLTEQIKIPFPTDKNYEATKNLYYKKTIAYLFATLGMGLVSYAEVILRSLAKTTRNIETQRDWFIWLTMVAVVGVLLFGSLTFKAFRLYLKYRDISKDIHHIGEALLNSLIEAGCITTARDHLKVQSAVDRMGAIYCHLEGGSSFEKSTFINSLQTIIGIVNNPRYIIIRKNKLLFLVKQKDYHAVPEILGRHKNLAEYFKTQWKKMVGNCDLVLTRTMEGRKILLQSRIKSLASQFENKVEQVNKWV